MAGRSHDRLAALGFFRRARVGGFAATGGRVALTARRIAAKKSTASRRSSASENLPKSRVEKSNANVVVSDSARRRKLIAAPLSAASAIMLRCNTTMVRFRGARRVDEAARRVHPRAGVARLERDRRGAVALRGGNGHDPAGAHVDGDGAVRESVARDRSPRLLTA